MSLPNCRKGKISSENFIATRLSSVNTGNAARKSAIDIPCEPRHL